jgi:L-threonylcarbamoyladenylate synthase
VEAELGDRVPFVLDAGPCEIGVESTVVLVKPDGRLRLLRPGGVSAEMLSRWTSHIDIQNRDARAMEGAPAMSPGLLASHYAPRKPLRMLPASWKAMSQSEREQWRLALTSPARVGLIVLSAAGEWAREGRSSGLRVAPLTQGELDFQEAARNLFATLRRLDDDPEIDVLWAEPMPTNEGICHAINDRLHRASHGHIPS